MCKSTGNPGCIGRGNIKCTEIILLIILLTSTNSNQNLQVKIFCFQILQASCLCITGNTHWSSLPEARNYREKDGKWYLDLIQKSLFISLKKLLRKDQMLLES